MADVLNEFSELNEDVTLNLNKFFTFMISLVFSLFNGISTFVGYSMPKPSL